MAKYLIEGGRKLEGSIKISGNKNSVLPCLAACLLTSEPVKLTNVPNISDVSVMVEILMQLGVKVEAGDHELTVHAENIRDHKLPQELVGKLRASILLIGPLLARIGRAEFSHPGGDIIGKRSIDTHILGLQKLGFKFSQKDRDYKGQRSSKLSGEVTVFLDEPSVTATENMVMASVLGSHKITLKNCAMEPHIVDLCNLLIQMGAKIHGVGTTILTVEGVASLTGAEFEIGPDYIEFGTYAVAAGITVGKIKIFGCGMKDWESVLVPLSKIGINFEVRGGEIIASTKGLKPINRLIVGPWPGFPTDLMSIFIVAATQAKGISLLHDWMYENRMFFVDKLISMGANITIADPHRVLVYGATKLWAREVETPDIRAGMALVLASLVAKGRSIINRAELIERGYEDVAGNLKSLGALIERLD